LFHNIATYGVFNLRWMKPDQNYLSWVVIELAQGFIQIEASVGKVVFPPSLREKTSKAVIPMQKLGVLNTAVKFVFYLCKEFVLNFKCENELDWSENLNWISLFGILYQTHISEFQINRLSKDVKEGLSLFQKGLPFILQFLNFIANHNVFKKWNLNYWNNQNNIFVEKYIFSCKSKPFGIFCTYLFLQGPNIFLQQFRFIPLKDNTVRFFS